MNPPRLTYILNPHPFCSHHFSQHLVVIVIFFPQTVTVFLDKPIEVDLKTIRIEVPPNDLQQPDDQNEQDTVNNLMRDLMKNTPQAK
jgi:hypothetical protein